MTPEQQKLAADNCNLIYAYINRENLDFEEWYGELAFALCRAAQIYDPSFGVTFSTLAWNCFMRRVKRVRWLACRSKRNLMQCVSLTWRTEEGDELQIDLPDEEDPYEEIDSRVAAENWTHNMLPHLKKKDPELLGYVLDGHTIAEISRKLGVPRQAIDYRVHRIRRAAIKNNLDPRAI
jgi:RNA polymerase sigma factor (sigma-70 family)